MSTEPVPFPEQYQAMRLYLQALAAMKPRGSWKRVGTAVASKYPVQTRIQAPSRGQYLTSRPP